MAPRKRGRAEMESDQPPPTPSLLTRLRSFWVFANVMQFVHLFGSAFKIDEDFDIEQLEDECLSPTPHYKLAEIGLCLLKAVSSQRGLTSADFDEHTSRQYSRRMPDHANPFGDGETPNRFIDLDIFTQLRILHQLTMWILSRREELRERMRRKDDENHTEWRMNPCGWDRQDRTYYILDDNRLYRRTDPPIPTAAEVAKAKKAEAAKPKPEAKPKPKAKPKSKPAPKPARGGTRSSKRLQKMPESQVEEAEVNGDHEAEVQHMQNGLQGDGKTPAEENGEAQDAEKEGATTATIAAGQPQPEDNDLGDGYKWECVAVTLKDYQDFLASIQKSRDANEKNLHKHIVDEVLPLLAKAEENRQKKIAKRERELASMEKMAHAKRSSRIAGKLEREREEAEKAEADKKRKKDVEAALADADRKRKMEEARESRTMTREQRMKEREYAKILKEEQLASLSEDSKQPEQAGGRKASERRLKSEIAKKKAELEALEQAEEDWVFDCAGCGVYGENLDDGTPIISCEKCNVWQHLECLEISEDEAAKDDFHFVCSDCHRKEREAKQREEDAKKPKIAPLKIRFDAAAEAEEAAEQPLKRKRGRPRKNPLLHEGELEGKSKRRKIEVTDLDSEAKGEAAKPKRKRAEEEKAPGLPPKKKFKVKGSEKPAAQGPSTQPTKNLNGTNSQAPGPKAGVTTTFIPFDPVAAGYKEQPAPKPAPQPQRPTGYQVFQMWEKEHQVESPQPPPKVGKSRWGPPTLDVGEQQPPTPHHGLTSSGSSRSTSPYTPASGNPFLPPAQSELLPGPLNTHPGFSPIKPPPPASTSPVQPAAQVSGLPSGQSPIMRPPVTESVERGLSPTKGHSAAEVERLTELARAKARRFSEELERKRSMSSEASKP